MLLPPPKEEWEQNRVTFPPLSLVCYTDGSRVANSQSGAGIYLEGQGGGAKLYALGSHTTVFQAEGVCYSDGSKPGENSQAALRAVSAPRTRSALFQQCADALEEVARYKEVTLDTVASQEMRRPMNWLDLDPRDAAWDQSPHLGITRQQLTAALNDWVQYIERALEVEQRLQASAPDPARSIWILGRIRETLNQLVGILTGHCKVRRHLSLLGIEEDPTCPRCGEDDETSYHFVGQCEAFRRLRLVVFASGTLSREELDSLGWSDILK
ncbi:hypothetical protein NQ317_016535 [Molorchus minor]|uniref:Uncharacterized protein n=1 Tax=Molorchus minor TaxID=1323400 RepID=A0ABQ9ISR1_9CUCU|nr:hypothetical protein NQ317_016535 [Molorchus minor]